MRENGKPLSEDEYMLLAKFEPRLRHPAKKGLDLVHFGVMLVLNLMIGQVTPPFGVCLFVISDVNKIKLEKLYKAILPWCIPLVLTLLMVTYLPHIVTWLPNLLLK
jgi:TRAP-type C4-dicarboxylate transport system permease large subunit